MYVLSFFLLGHFPTSSTAPWRRAVAGSCGWKAWVWEGFPVSSLGPSSLGTPFSCTWHGYVFCPLCPCMVSVSHSHLLQPDCAPWCERNCVPWWTQGPSLVITAKGGGADLGVSALPPFYPGQLALLPRAVERGQDGACLWAAVPGIVGATSPPRLQLLSPCLTRCALPLFIHGDHFLPSLISFFLIY